MIISSKIIEKIKKKPSNSYGTINQTHKTNINLTIGLTQKIKLCLLPGNIKFLINNFTASLIGWRRPIKEGLLGPSRLWEYPKILRSIRVIKAMFTKTITIKINKSASTKKLKITFKKFLHSFKVTLCISYKSLHYLNY